MERRNCKDESGGLPCPTRIKQYSGCSTGEPHRRQRRCKRREITAHLAKETKKQRHDGFYTDVTRDDDLPFKQVECSANVDRRIVVDGPQYRVREPNEYADDQDPEPYPASTEEGCTTE
ncbi:hypothetical protein GCM10022627_31980 [Haloarcula argentinensis]